MRDKAREGESTDEGFRRRTRSVGVLTTEVQSEAEVVGGRHVDRCRCCGQPGSVFGSIPHSTPKAVVG